MGIAAKAIVVLSETGETARYVAKFHPYCPIMAVMAEGSIGRQIEGYMSHAFSLVTNVKRGDGAHVKLAFEEGKKKGLFSNGDSGLRAHDAQLGRRQAVYGAHPLRDYGRPAPPDDPRRHRLLHLVRR